MTTTESAVYYTGLAIDCEQHGAKESAAFYREVAAMYDCVLREPAREIGECVGGVQ